MCAWSAKYRKRSAGNSSRKWRRTDNPPTPESSTPTGPSAATFNRAGRGRQCSHQPQALSRWSAQFAPGRLGLRQQVGHLVLIRCAARSVPRSRKITASRRPAVSRRAGQPATVVPVGVERGHGRRGVNASAHLTAAQPPGSGGQARAVVSSRRRRWTVAHPPRCRPRSTAMCRPRCLFR
jgi:hypothetical protein